MKKKRGRTGEEGIATGGFWFSVFEVRELSMFKSPWQDPAEKVR